MKIKDSTEKKGINKVAVSIISVLVAIVLIIILLYVFLIYPQTYVAKIGNDVITIKEYKYVLEQTKIQMLTSVGLQPGADPQSEQSFWSTQLSDGSTYYSYAKSRALQEAMNTSITIQKAKEKGIKLTSEDKVKINGVIESQYTQFENGKAGFRTYLREAMGMGLSDYRGIMEDFLISDKFKTETISAYEIFDTDLEAAYQENLESLKSVTVRHILVLEENMSDEEAKKAALGKAEIILNRIENGEDMETLASELSEDPGVVDNKGLYSFDKEGRDIVTGGGYVLEFPEWAFDNKEVGDLGIVETTYGFHVMRLEEINITSYEEIKENLRTYLQDNKYNEELTGWFEEVTYKINEEVLQETN